MKANEAPEEIYLLLDGRYDNGLSICWYEAPYSTGAIEYTRTDVFIEKACEWIDKTLRNTDFYENEIELFIKEFKKYMEGE